MSGLRGSNPVKSLTYMYVKVWVYMFKEIIAKLMSCSCGKKAPEDINAVKEAEESKK
jgi:hypothetical protein